MRNEYRAPEATTIDGRGWRRSILPLVLRRLRSLDDDMVGDALGAAALAVTLIAGLWVAYGVLG